MVPEALWLSCGVLQTELEHLMAQGRIRGRLRFLESMLHMDPVLLEARLVMELEQIKDADLPTVLVYGDCSHRMVDLCAKYRVRRVMALNCAQMLLGRARYRELMHAEAFMFLPEWAHRWRHILSGELGLSQGVARDLMGENRRELVYLDAGLEPVPLEELQECSRYLGLPLRKEKVGLDNLVLLLEDALARGDKP